MSRNLQTETLGRSKSLVGLNEQGCMSSISFGHAMVANIERGYILLLG